jgi:hypothetical protein
MKTKSTKLLLGCLLGAGMMLGGCKSAPPPAAAPAATTAGTTNPDGSITNPDGSVTYPAGTAQAREARGTKNSDGSITNPDGSITYPAGTKPAQSAGPSDQAAVAKGPGSTAAPAPEAPKEVARKALTVPSGTRVAVSMSETLRASKNNAGDSFSGVLAQPIQTAHGETLYPRGTRVSGTVTAAKGRGRFKGAGDLAIEVTSIGGRNVSTTAYEKAQAGKGKRTAGMVGGGAGLGAIIGGLAGGGKGALIGGLAGAGAGTAASAYTGNKDVVIPAESVVTFTLTAPLSR